MPNEDSIHRYLRHPRPETFDRVASRLLGSQSLLGERLVPRPGKGPNPAEPSWRTASPVRLDEPADEQRSPADPSTLREAMRAHWKALSRSPASPLLLLLTEETALERRLASAVREDGGDEGVFHASEGGRTDALGIRSWLGARQRGDRRAWILTTDAHCERLLQDLERRRLRFRLPAGSRLYRLSSVEALRDRHGPLPAEVATALGIPRESQSVLVAAPSLASMVEVTPDEFGTFRLAPPPPWVRYEVVDDATGDASCGAARLAVLDLATTRLPAFQILDWPIETVGDDIRLLWTG